MSFRLKLLAVVAGAVVASVVAVSWTVLATTRRAFERLEDERTRAAVERFRREFARRGDEVSRRVEGIAAAEATLRIALDLARPQADPAPYVDEAAALAASWGLDLLELVAADGAIISSAHWPARFGYHNAWVTAPVEWRAEPPFLRREELAEDKVLAVMAVRVVMAGEKRLYVVGGQRLGDAFLASLSLPAGMRAELSDAAAPETRAGPLAALAAPLVAGVRRERREITRMVGEAEAAETVQAIPLFGRSRDLLAVLLVAGSRREMVLLARFIRRTALVVGAAGILLGVALSSWAAARVTRPVERLAAGARAVAAGDWTTQVDAGSADEIGQLARAFNLMTRRLLEQREQLVQAERVAAWRELARRLAHELKNPLFPLQITVENLQRARRESPEQFDEVFRESTTTLLAELANLKTIVGRFSDFAKMPPPQFEPVRVNDVVGQVLQLFEPQLRAAGVTLESRLEAGAGALPADPDQLGRAVRNLVLNALDAMPQGGVLAVRTERRPDGVAIEVSDTGAGLTPEERERLFTPYYTTKQHGTGLGLAIVQSVVSDHHGRITVASEPGRGTTFRIELPEHHG